MANLRLLGHAVLWVWLILFVYCLMFIVLNLKDQPPSATMIEYQQAWTNRIKLDPEDNGYLYLLGFNTAEGLAPKKAGIDRLSWLELQKNNSYADPLLFPDGSFDFRAKIPKPIKQLLDSCKVVNDQCAALLTTLIDELASPSAAETLLMQRYFELLSHGGWREEIMGYNFPLPDYSQVLVTQQLIFVRSFTNKELKNLALAEFLNRDQKFWRIVLKNSDYMVTKMIAVAAIKNNLIWTNQLLLKSGDEEFREHLLLSLKRPFNEEELSLQRCFVGEWISSNLSFEAGFYSRHLTPAEIWVAELIYKRVDSMNQMAERLSLIQSSVDVTIDKFENALENYNKLETSKSPSLVNFILKPYNPGGKILMDIAEPPYASYVVRTKDLEAFRRGLLASIELMGNPQLDPNTLTDRSLYKSKPWVIDEQQRTITVTGLGADSRAVQTYYY